MLLAAILECQEMGSVSDELRASAVTGDPRGAAAEDRNSFSVQHHAGAMMGL